MLDGFRMAARVDNGRVQLLTRTGLDWTDNSNWSATAHV
jgi:bifunctional non-homologous end joining protein LigD